MRGTFALPFAFVVGLGLGAGACSPADRQTVREVTPPATRALCVLLRAFTSSGTVDEVCATAEELAPFVPEILAQRAAGKAPAAAEAVNGAALAFVLPEPPRRTPRRRCVSWVDLSGSIDAGSSRPADGGGRDE